MLLEAHGDTLGHLEILIKAILRTFLLLITDGPKMTMVILNDE